MTTPSLADKVAFLRQPESYPVRTVEVKETHMSWVFLTETQAWKLKKPVRTAYLDFSTLAARRHNCEMEVQLNWRLAPDVYLGIVPLTVDAQGAMQLGGEGEIIDWLVRMRRLPAERMLDYALAHQTIADADVRKVGRLLARFYQQAVPVTMPPSEYRRRLVADVRASQCELSKPKYELPIVLAESVAEAQLQLLKQEAVIFDDRVRAGKIVEGHGDLRPEHICLERDPVIIDCLEFNRDFRILDAVSELAFLALECERLNAARVGNLILQTYSEETGDRPPEKLLMFYKSFHACLRAKIAVWHLQDDEVTERAKWIGKARLYLNLAACLLPTRG